MHSETFCISDDLPPSLRMLAEQFCSDAFRIRGVTLHTLRLEVCYLCRFFRHFGPPASSDKLFQKISPGSISDFLQDYARAYSSGSLAGMQSLLRSFLRFAYRASRIESDLAELVPIRKHRRLGTVPRSLPDECIERLRNSIDRSTAEGMRDAAIICLLAWSTRLDGNVNRFSARFINQVSLLDGNVKSESLFRTPSRYQAGWQCELFRKKFVIQSGSPEIRCELKPSENPISFTLFSSVHSFPHLVQRSLLFLEQIFTAVFQRTLVRNRVEPVLEIQLPIR